MALRTMGIWAAFALVVAAGCKDGDDEPDDAGGGSGGTAASSASGGAPGGAGMAGGSAGMAGGSAGMAGGTAGMAGAAGMAGSAGMAGAAGMAGGAAGMTAGSGGGAGMAGGGATESGVAPSTRLDALTDSDRQKLCAWGATLPGLGMEVACPDGSTVVAEVEVGDACVDSLSGVSDCAATASEFEACIHAQLDDPCEFFVSECDPVFACLF